MVIIKVTKISGFSCQNKGHPMTCPCTYRRTADAQLQPMRNSALENGGLSAPGFRPLTPQERTCTHRTGSWVGLGARMDTTENLAFTRVRAPKRPARSESLYRLSPRVFVSLSFIFCHRELTVGYRDIVD